MKNNPYDRENRACPGGAQYTSAACWQQIVESMHEGVWILDPDGTITYVNPQMAMMLGYTPDEMIGRNGFDFVWPEDGPPGRQESQRWWMDATGRQAEHRYRHKSGRPVWRLASSRAILDAEGRSMGVLGMFLSAPQHRQESNLLLRSEVLRILNAGGDLQLLMAQVLRAIRQHTGFDAVGLRMREGQDFPYYQQNGFSEEFLREENSLCAKREDGSVLRDATGQAVLECTCGLILSGRTDPALSCFTEGGSFWTSRASDLLWLLPEADPRTNPRNYCIHSGYQSIALIPVRSGQGIIGLLQLNARPEGQLTLEMVHFFEGLAGNIGLAIQRERAEEARRELNTTLENKIAARTAELEQRTKQLQRLSLQLSQARDREHRRIAVFLHEDLQQQIAGARLYLSVLNGRTRHDPRQQAAVANIDDTLREAIEKSRSLSSELSPAVLHQNDMGETLPWLAAQLRTLHGLAVHVTTVGEVRLHSNGLAIFLFRAAEEMLFNVAKHAGVREASVRAVRRGRYVRLSVSDEGQGLDPNRLRETSGFGLLCLREQSELLGGRMAIRTAPGRGSTFHIIVPDSLPKGC